jgi:type VI protein secretion system component VasF
MRAMEQAPSASDGENRVRRGSSLADTWDAWEEYYRKASVRRRSSGARHSLRNSKRRRRIRERIALLGSAAGMALLVLVFYLVLSHH